MSDHPLVTTGVTATGCQACGRPLRDGRSDRRYCSPACRQAAHRRRQAQPRPLAARTPPAQTIYECPACGTRQLGEQRCDDCGVFSRRIGPGGPCPHCDEPVALADLIESA